MDEDEDERAVVEREIRLLQPIVRHDQAEALTLLHPDFMEYGSSGRVWDRSSIPGATAETAGPIEAVDMEAHRLGPDAFLVTYRSVEAGRVALRSSTWLRQDGEWLLRFHQGTVSADG